jgi:16S rRNA (guanine966-N2)-methyltransferase
MKRRPSALSGRIRIVGGDLRGSRIDVADAPGLRPTPERVRETLFNWLQPVISGARVLDLFAGTGALGIEALSRGAASVLFVERDRSLATALRGHLQRLRQSAGRVEVADAVNWLEGTPAPFDLVFLDPPFAAGLWSKVAKRLEHGGWLAPHAWIYVESPSDVTPQLPAGWQLHREGRAGDVRYALYRRLPSAVDNSPACP